MGNPSGVKIEKADLDEDDRGITVTGYVSPESFDLLNVDAYQREELSPTKISDLMEAHRQSRVPTVELGMRGDEDGVDMRGTTYYLTDPTYIVDGLQRITAAKRLLEVEPDSNPRIQAVIHLNTNFDWERRRFEVLNVNQTRVNGNVLLHNQRFSNDNEVVELLYKLSQSKTFVLGDKIAWGQSMRRTELISALTFVRTIGILHGHIGPGRAKNSLELAKGLQKIMDRTGKMTLRKNVVTFFDMVNVCFGVETVAYRSSAVQLKSGFLFALASMLSDHTNFWMSSQLTIDKPALNKLRSFSINDPSTVLLAGASGGQSSEVLADRLAKHVAKGRRTNTLERRAYADSMDIELEAGNDVE